MKVGIIGGSGLDDPKLLEDYEEKEVNTSYGKPSSKVTCGKLNGVDVCILARHGRNHEIPPSQVNFRANIAALKILGCECVLATSAVGSLKERIRPGDLVFPNQFIDFTKHRKNTFYDKEGEVKHTGMADPFSKRLRGILIQGARELCFDRHDSATIVVVEGPRFSSRAESFMFRNYADIIGMTTVPECNLAREAEMEYASIAMSTDYDCWKEDEDPVTFEMVMARMRQNADKVKKLIMLVLPMIARGEEAPTLEDFGGGGKGFVGGGGGFEVKEVSDAEFIKSKIRTIPDFPKPGIMFRDITTLLKDRDGFEKVVDVFYNRYKNRAIDAVAGIEARGFILGGVLANKLGVGFIPIRKPGKLPGETVKEEYSLEYGSDAVEIHRDAISPGAKILLIDDLLATGGTSLASCNLIERLGGQVVEIGFVVELPALGGRGKLGRWDVFGMVGFEGE